MMAQLETTCRRDSIPNYTSDMVLALSELANSYIVLNHAVPPHIQIVLSIAKVLQPLEIKADALLTSKPNLRISFVPFNKHDKATRVGTIKCKLVDVLTDVKVCRDIVKLLKDQHKQYGYVVMVTEDAIEKLQYVQPCSYTSWSEYHFGCRELRLLIKFSICKNDRGKNMVYKLIKGKGVCCDRFSNEEKYS